MGVGVEGVVTGAGWGWWGDVGVVGVVTGAGVGMVVRVVGCRASGGGGDGCVWCMGGVRGGMEGA